MTRIADLICDTTSSPDAQCDLVVGGDTSVRDALTMMQDSGSDFIAVSQGADGFDAVLSRQEVLNGLLSEFDSTEGQLVQLQSQIDSQYRDQLGLVQEGVDSLLLHEKTVLETAVDYLTEGLVILDVDGRVKRANPCSKKLLGLAVECSEIAIEEEFKGLGFAELIARDEYLTGDRWGEYKVKNSNGNILQIRWTHINADSGDLIGKVVTINDVTNDQADEKAKTEFIASITHELRTPLTIIQNSVSNILAGVTGRVNRRTRDYLDTILSDCHRFGGLISDLLDVSKIENGKMVVDRKAVKLSVLIRDAVAKFSVEASRKKIQIIERIEGSVPVVYVDHDRICQVLENLVNNAIKYTREGGMVVIANYERQDDVVVMVEDSGIGIDPSLQEQVFNKFHQIGRQAGAGYKGAGLGLPICDGIIKIHGGKIWVESEPGLGSKFFFSLPKTDASLVLNRHICEVAREVDKTGGEFVLLEVKFNSVEDRFAQEKIDEVCRQLLIESNKFLTGNVDVALRVSDTEFFFVAIGSHKLSQMKKEINSILLQNDIDLKMFKCKIGHAIYPNDTTEVIEIENLVRSRAGKVF
jgi:signal transduction histidine kinase